jgi:hypothetical protein
MLTRGLVLQRNAATISKITKSQYHKSPRLWFERLFTDPNAPKGFGKFFPKGSSSAGNGAGKAGEGATKNASKGTGGGGGGKKKPDFPQIPEGNMQSVAIAAATLVAVGLAVSSGDKKQGKEISWQEFQSQLLESGQVDRILISNKTTARVVLRQPVELNGSGSQDKSWARAPAGNNTRDSATYGTGGNQADFKADGESCTVYIRSN